MGFPCISGYLRAVVPLALHGTDVTHVAGCFIVFIGRVGVTNDNVVLIGWSDLPVSSLYLRTFSHLSVMVPTSSILMDVCWRYGRTFLPEVTLGEPRSNFQYSL